MTGTVLVTGATGYIGGELIDQLLAKRWTVHGTVRSLARSEAGLRARFADASDRLRLFEADLMDDAGWAEAVAGCSHVAHVASPFPVGVPKDEDDLIVPAREGTLRALRFARDAGATHFVQTSSSAAIAYGHPKEKIDFDEGDWTNINAPGVQPYVKSKTIAERAARDWMMTDGANMAFCSVNPVAVLGPVRSDDLSASIELVRRFLTGEIPAIPPVGIGVVDVRDVASLHVLALEAEPEAIDGERFIASARYMGMEEIAHILRERLGKRARKVPKRKMPRWLLDLLALFNSDIRQIAGEMGKKKFVSSAHAQAKLGWSPLPVEETIADTAESLIAQGVVKL